MAYIVGLLNPKEEKELKRRGWTLEEAPKELIPEDTTPGMQMWMVWVDNNMFSVMDGPDWEKGPKESS